LLVGGDSGIGRKIRLRQSERPRFNSTLAGYAARVLAPFSPILLSNRGPFEVGRGSKFRRGQGGLVSALLSVAEASGATWLALARNPLERDLAQKGMPLRIVRRGHEPVVAEWVDVEPWRYRLHYSVIANPLLWFLQHHLWNLATEPTIDGTIGRAWEEGYVAVNRLLGERVAEISRQVPKVPLVMTQDYQLYLAPTAIRASLPSAVMQHFVHIPWPAPQYWKVLPARFREPIVAGLLANDIVGFQTERDVHNFIDTCADLLGLRVQRTEQAVLFGGRAVWVRAYPISVDVDALCRLSKSDGVAAEAKLISGWRRQHLLVRVDRADPSKNIVRGLLGYERLLECHPELHRTISFWCFLQPTRQDVIAYRHYAQLIIATAARVNRRFASRDWEPIRLEFAENMRRAVAAFQNYDVLLVNSIYDGMNLVAKEGPVVNQRDGVVVLSENAGSHEELRDDVVSINPFDIDATGEALYTALTMPAVERRRRLEGIRRRVRAHDLGAWLMNQMYDIRSLVTMPNRQAP
jgi:trehalose 6-phosphate synthase